MTTRSPKDIMDEARAIVAEWKYKPKNYPKPVGQVARLLELRQERAIPANDFARQINLSVTTIYLWENGCKTSGNAWPELISERAMRRGSAVAALMNADLPARPKPDEPKEPTRPSTTLGVRGLVSALRRRLESLTGAIDVSVVVDIVSVFRQTRHGVDYFSRNVGVSANDLRQWNSGKTASGGEWPALVTALKDAGIEPSRRTLRPEKSVRLPATAAAQAKDKPRATPALKADPLAMPVTKFRAVDGSEHDNAAQARARSLQHAVALAAKDLADAMSGRGDTLEESLFELPHEVIALADAHKALLMVDEAATRAENARRYQAT